MDLTAVATASPSASAVAAVPSAVRDAVAPLASTDRAPTDDRRDADARADPDGHARRRARPPTPDPDDDADVDPGTPRPPSRRRRPTATRCSTACPDAPNCWIYKVRSGDNLFSIANYFGVPLARVYAMNPWLESTGLRAGQSLRLPPPTR